MNRFEQFKIQAIYILKNLCPIGLLVLLGIDLLIFILLFALLTCQMLKI